MDIATAVITCPQRERTLLPQTLASIRRAGFPEPLVRCDNANLGPLPHWHATAVEVFYRNRFADRLIIFQDDILCVRNLAEYLNRCEYPTDGYWNLATIHSNVHAAKRAGTRWFAGRPSGLGALGLVFDNKCLRTLLGSPGLLDWATDPDAPRRYPRYVDGGIATTLAKAGYTQYCHNPSLLKHTGTTSAARPHKTWKDDLNALFPGEDFDALSLL